MEKKPNIGLIIIVIIVLMSTFAYWYHAISNPTLTITQNFIWLFGEINWWIFSTVVMIVSYLIIAIFTKK